MTIKKTASAHWQGGIKDGKGRISTQSGALKDQPYGFNTRFEDQPGTNPEELIGAAHAGCFSMALSAGLGKAGFTPTRVHTKATVHLEKVGESFSITRIDLDTEAEVPGIDEKAFMEQAEGAKKGCPVSKALTGTEIKLNARLVSGAAH
jgi:osmotically inducible protein OsmC